MEYMLTVYKHGNCPGNFLVSTDQQPCFDDCFGFDYKCPHIQKCCWIGCHRQCQNVENLEYVSLFILPPIPENISVASTEHFVDRTAQISWELDWNDTLNYSQTKFIIEGRSHVGATCFTHKLSDWMVFEQENMNNIQKQTIQNTIYRYKLPLTLKIGRWYEFRIITINANGTRGYSGSSSPFQLTESKLYFISILLLLQLFIHFFPSSFLLQNPNL